MEDAVAEEYKSSLADLTCNSKPYISMLTILAEENVKYAPQLVKTITDHVLEVAPEAKLPCLYLIDSIIKNVRKPYLSLFSVNIVSIFASVFEKVDENTRMLLYKLRQTWNEIFTNKILYSLDTRVKEVDPAWPVTAQPPTPSIHINPKFLDAAASAQKSQDQQPLLAQKEEAKLKAQQNEVLKQLFVKQEQLRLLEQKKRELATKQFLSSDSGNLADIAAVSSIQPRGVDPRVAAKLNPKLSQRDPRLQKVVVATVLKKNLAQAKAGTTKTKEAAQVPPDAPDSLIAKVTPFLPVPSFPDSCDKTVSDSPEPQGSSKQDHSSQPLDEHQAENKSTESIDTTRSSRKARPDKEGPTKREQSSSPSSRTSGKKKRKTEDSKNEESEKEPSPKKLPKGKGGKKKDSPRKSSASSEERKEGKKQQQSRSPVDKVEKKAVNQDSYSEKDKKIEVENDDSKHADRKIMKQEPKDEDTDLRKITKEETRIKREIDSESKEDCDDPPSKKQKEMQGKDSDTDSLFGHEDQDYRQLSKNGKFSHLKGWAMYKAAHPEEFKIPRRQYSYNNDMENQQPHFADHEKNDGGGKMGPQHFREDFDQGPVEYDRLGRVRLSKMRRNQKFGYQQTFSQREEAFRITDQGPFLDKRLQDVFFTSVMGVPKDMLRQAEEQYRLGRINEKDFTYIQKELERMWASEEYRRFKAFRDFSRMPNFGNMKGMPLMPNRNQDFMNCPKGRIQENMPPQLKDNLRQGHPMPPPAVRTFRLDNKSRTIHFVEDKAIILMDNEEPRELTFRGEPTSVFIQGLKPITMRFDGRPVEFQLDGHIYSMKFGSPSRELYINNHPYEGKFGGPPFDVMLNGRVHRVSLGGPPPQVQVGEHPVHDLYRKFLAATRGNPEMPLPPGNNRAHAPPPEILRDHSNVVPFDVDMRSERMPVRNSGEIRDIDWRQAAPTSDVRETRERGYDFSSNGSPPFSEEQSQRMDPALRNPSQGPNEWSRRDEPNRNSFPREQIPPPQPDWRKFPPPLHDVKMPYSPHHTPPQEGHPSEWEQPPSSRQYDEPGKNSYEPSNRRWIQGDFPHEGSRPGPPPHPPPPLPQVSEPGNMYNMHSNSPQQYDAYPEYRGSEPRMPSNVPIRPPMRPPFNPHLNRPEFRGQAPMTGILPRPPMPPWIQNQRPPRPEAIRHPVLPPPPRPPMHMKMPESFIRALPPVSETPTVEPVTSAQPSTSDVTSGTQSTSVVTALPPPPLPPMMASEAQVVSIKTEPIATDPPVLNFDISTLFEKLVSAGIISKPNPDTDAKKSTEENEEEEEEKDAEGKKGKEKDPNEEPVPPIELKLECLKVRYSGVTSALYRGSQCASCGMRFKEIHGERYSRHLDWHFRVNRREKDGVKKAFSRKWYYEVEDWIQFEEFEDFEERARSFFELQADEQFQMEAEVEVPSVPVSGQETEACVVCGELFQLFWVEEEEEWHLRNAVRHESQAYHPSCYEDYKKSLEGPVKEEAKEEDKTSISEVDVKDSSIIDTPEVTMVEIKKEPEDTDEIDDAVAEVVRMLADTTVEDYEQKRKEEEEQEQMQLSVVKEEPKEEEEEEELQGKPGEEEIIGVITEADNESECKPVDESEKVVFKSGGIVMKVRAESLKPASPCPENVTGKEGDIKGDADESEGEEEFRPPTPDPRFQVLPPVQRGTELSGLCCIM